MSGPVRFDVWVCRGRLCSAGGSARLFDACVASSSSRPDVAVLRGGCYGLCEVGPNVVVRRRRGAAPVGQSEPRPGDPEGDDRLSLTGGADEHVYCGVAVDDVEALLDAHLNRDEPLVRLTRAVREREMVPRTPIEERIRALRASRARRDEEPHE